jgi:hypothetical protein
MSSTYIRQYSKVFAARQANAAEYWGQLNIDNTDGVVRGDVFEEETGFARCGRCSRSLRGRWWRRRR